jgi:hypothetical protein
MTISINTFLLVTIIAEFSHFHIITFSHFQIFTFPNFHISTFSHFHIFLNRLSLYIFRNNDSKLWEGANAGESSSFRSGEIR